MRFPLRPVREALAANLRTGEDIGSSAAVFLDGEPVVDVWGGYADEARTQPWQRDTIVNAFSTTKTMTALSALILADRGELDFNAPVARYWPEFATEGKGQMGGSGGSFVINDLDARMTVAFVMTKHVESNDVDHRSVDVVRAAYECLLGEPMRP